jgi:tripartite-type tricarboxylate transporter receptor subunit TctC
MDKNFLLRLSCVLSVTLLGVSDLTSGQTYPSRPLRLVVPFTAGGGTDLIARAVGVKLNEAWGQPIVIDNRTGGTGAVGSLLVAQAQPDGYTLIMVTASTHAISPNFFRKPVFNPIKDFAPITVMANSHEVVVAHPSAGIGSIKELVALAHAKPGNLNYASAGTGTIGHVTAELFKIVTGTKITHIPYKGTGDAIRDLLGGQVQIMFGAPGAVIQHVRSGRIKALAICYRERIPQLKEVPTMTEAGYPSIEASNWYAMLAPAGTPQPIITRLNQQITTIMRLPEIKQQLYLQGYEAVSSTPQELATMLETDLAKWGKVVKTIGLQIN